MGIKSRRHGALDETLNVASSRHATLKPAGLFHTAQPPVKSSLPFCVPLALALSPVSKRFSSVPGETGTMTASMPRNDERAGG